MDEETEAALELTRDELLAMRDAGTPGRVAKRPRDLNQLGASILNDAAELPSSEVAWAVAVPAPGEIRVTFEGLKVEPGFKEQDRFLAVGHPSVKVG